MIKDFLLGVRSQQETIDRMTAETRMMNVIRRLIILTNDCRPSDIQAITDRLDRAICDIMKLKQKREEKPVKTFQVRDDDKRSGFDKQA